MSTAVNVSDVPPVNVGDLLLPMQAAIAKGQGLALLNGMSEAAIRDLETLIWSQFSGDPQIRLAVALRLRALLDVFQSRRLKQLFLLNGFKLIGRAVAEASSQRFNAEFGFNVQKFVFALSAPAGGTASHTLQGTDHAAIREAA